METRQIAAIVLILAAIAVLYYFLALPQEEAPPELPPEEKAEYPPPFAEEGKNTTLGEFALNLLAADRVYLVEDLRDLETYPLSRTNIMQCGNDYAGSEGLVGKELIVYALDDGDACHTNAGTLTMDECYAELVSGAEEPGSAMIWIEKGNGPEFYSRGLLVRINESYSIGLCTTNLVAPVANDTALNETPTPAGPDGTEPPINETEAPEPEMNETGPEANETTEEGPGDAHTFP